MDNKNILVDEVIERVKALREKVQNDVDDGVIQEFDEILRELDETKHELDSQKANQKALELLGKVLKWLPTIKMLIEILKDQL